MYVLQVQAMLQIPSIRCGNLFPVYHEWFQEHSSQDLDKYENIVSFGFTVATNLGTQGHIYLGHIQVWCLIGVIYNSSQDNNYGNLYNIEGYNAIINMHACVTYEFDITLFSCRYLALRCL